MVNKIKGVNKIGVRIRKPGNSLEIRPGFVSQRSYWGRGCRRGLMRPGFTRSSLVLSVLFPRDPSADGSSYHPGPAPVLFGVDQSCSGWQVRL